KRYLTDAELGRLGSVLVNAQDNSVETPFAMAAVWLLILTGARLTEILTLKWVMVDFENAVLTLPDSKTGAKPIYLNAAAMALLQAMPRLHGNPYVIVGKKAGSRLINLQKPWRRLRKQADLDGVRIHDLRHSFASVAVSS